MKPTNPKSTIPLRNGQAARQVERERKAGWNMDFARSANYRDLPDGSRPEGNQSAKAEVTHESEAAGRSLARSAFYSLAPRLAGPYDASAPVGCCFLACLSHSARGCVRKESLAERAGSLFRSVSLAR